MGSGAAAGHVRPSPQRLILDQVLITELVGRGWTVLVWPTLVRAPAAWLDGLTPRHPREKLPYRAGVEGVVAAHANLPERQFTLYRDGATAAV